MHYPRITIEISRREAPMAYSGSDDADGDPGYEPWEDGLPRQFYKSAITVVASADTEPRFASLESPCFLPDQEQRNLISVLLVSCELVNREFGACTPKKSDK